MIPDDLPDVSIVGTPRRLPRHEAPGGHWEWLAVELESSGVTIAVFDPDHVCPPGTLGRRAYIGLELFHPQVTANEREQSTITIAPMASGGVAAPVVHGQVIDHHHHWWRYSGPVLRLAPPCAGAVSHVIDAPHRTLRLVVAASCGTLLVQLKDGRRVPDIAAWVTLRGGRFELLTILPGE